jgi:pimeloyl-ACP methyl ester carboxylesterase
MLYLPGTRLSYSRVGSGPPVLLIQGCGVVGEGWRPQVDGLSDRFSVITFDHRGIGDSTVTDGTFSIEAFARDALAILDAERIGKCHVVGHSMGGLVAMHLALTAPERVRSLSLLCTFADGRSGASMTPAMLIRALRMRLGTRSARRQAFLELVMPDSILQQADVAQLAEQLQPMFGRDLADQPPIILRQVLAMTRYDATPRLMELAATRTLVVSAGRDRVAPPVLGRHLAARIPGARYVEIPGAGHGVPMHAPAVVHRHLEEHFGAIELEEFESERKLISMENVLRLVGEGAF